MVASTFDWSVAIFTGSAAVIMVARIARRVMGMPSVCGKLRMRNARGVRQACARHMARAEHEGRERREKILEAESHRICRGRSLTRLSGWIIYTLARYLSNG